MATITPWAIFRVHARSVGIAIATCLALLIAIEFGIFRSGFFASHVAISDAESAAAKLALASRQSDAAVLYVGDSTIMTSVVPSVVSARCECGPGFNAGFAAANPWMTQVMVRRLLDTTHPRIVVIDVTPWTFDSAAVFHQSDFARDLLSPDELAALGAPLDLPASIDARLGTFWSAYGQRNLLKEWLSALAPGQRYDESLLGYYVAPGSANSYARVVAAAGRLFEDVGQPTVSAPGARVIGSLIDDLRARGIAVAIFTPPLHSAAREIAGPYLDRTDAAVRDLASAHGVPVIDCRASVGPDDFRDATHLLTPAAEKHSQCVGEQLRALAVR
jgi:hypothetical protein